MNIFALAQRIYEQTGPRPTDRTALSLDGVTVEVIPQPGSTRYEWRGDDGATFEGVRFEAVAERPEGFPDHLPFLPERACMLSVDPEGSLGVSWKRLTDAPSDLERVRDELERGDGPGQGVVSDPAPV